MEDFNEILTQFAQNVIADLRYNMSSYDMGDTKLAKSLDYTIYGNEVIITAAPYWDYAQVGRPAGKVPYNFQDIISLWATERGIRVPDLMKFSNSVKWNTIKHGSNLYNNPSKHRDFEADAIDENVDWLEKAVAVYIKDKL